MLSLKHVTRLTQEKCEKPKVLYLRMIYIFSNFLAVCYWKDIVIVK